MSTIKSIDYISRIPDESTTMISMGKIFMESSKAEKTASGSMLCENVRKTGSSILY